MKMVLSVKMIVVGIGKILKVNGMRKKIVLSFRKVGGSVDITILMKYTTMSLMMKS